jgi:hypothetical protein
MLSVMPSTQAAPKIKAGKPCVTQSQLQIVKGQVFICQSNSVGKSWKFIIKRKKLSEYERTKLIAFSEINGAIESRNSGRAIIKYGIGKSFPQDLSDLYKKQTEKASRLYGSFFTKPETVNIHLYTEKETDFVDSFPVFANTSDQFTRKDWYKRWESGQGREHNIGLAAFFSEYPTGVWEGHAGLMVYSGASKYSLRRYAMQVMPHEYFHVVQDYYFRKQWEDFLRENNKLGGNGMDTYDTYFPPIYREGSANTISFAVASDSADYYLDFYKYFSDEKKRQTEIKAFKRLNSEGSVIEVLRSLELRSKNEEAHEASYMIGQLVFEWLIAKYGFEAYERIIKNQLTGDGFEDNLKKSVGISLQQLYEGSAPHIVAAFR